MKLTNLTCMVVLIATIVSGCANIKNFESSGILYFKSTPAAISNVWTDGVDTYILPARGYSITSISTPGKSEIKVDKSGSYLKLFGVHPIFEISLNGVSYSVSRD